MSQFAGRVAAVTGAGSGIGRALALGLAQRGARLALSDVGREGLAETARQAQARGGAEVATEVVDVSDREALRRWAGAVVERYDVVNQLYNNAGIAFSKSVLESDLADYDRVLGINLMGVIAGTKAFLPHLIASGDGHVVNVSSLNGFMAQAEMSHYVASKFAVRGFTETLRLEMQTAGHPVRVSVVHPGGIKTNIATAAMDHSRASGATISAEDEARQRTYNEKLLKMLPEEAAEVILTGVERDRPRILVGNDARAVDVLVRTLPSTYPKIVIAATKRFLR